MTVMIFINLSRKYIFLFHVISSPQRSHGFKVSVRPEG